VQHISPKGGDLRLALYDRKGFADDNAEPIIDTVAPAKGYSVLVTFAPVRPGTYAVKMFQDENRNGEFDQNFIGLPKERYGFSNNVGPDWMRLSAPSFDAAKIELKPGENKISIWLH
ncbi:MAG: DUF2141 domain-containing protein, partial [Alphaproteobacteria bacterium]|nr:DUF2141 domain-containing protein [Alphaproteobacteria bacterium]